MSVLLIMRMDIHVGAGSFADARKKAFPDPAAGVKRILQLPGLQWKIWISNEERRQSGGVYLFASREAAEKYAAGAVRSLQELPGVSNVTAEIWDISEAPTHATAGPVDVPLLQDRQPV